MKCLAVTGCAGFIGSRVARQLLERGDLVYGVDALTYAANPDVVNDLARLGGRDRFHFIAKDINDLGAWPDIDAVIHLAAETHVDNSLTHSERFLHTNILGVAHLLEMTRVSPHPARFIHISTDEVYGDVSHGETREDAPLCPSSPYAASKAAGDHLIQAWARSYGLTYNIVRPSNCYGTGQYPEKLIPKAVRYQQMGKNFPLHGSGKQTRYWLDVEDCASAILAVLDHGERNAIYNVGGNTEASVLDILKAVGTDELWDGVVRPGVDKRYHVNDDALRALKWEPKGDLWRDLPGILEAERQTLRW